VSIGFDIDACASNLLTHGCTSRQPYVLTISKRVREPLWLVNELGRPLAGVLNNGTKSGSIFLVTPSQQGTAVYVRLGALNVPMGAGLANPSGADALSNWSSLVNEAVLDLTYGVYTLRFTVQISDSLGWFYAHYSLDNPLVYA
jgi:hypothetical protein